MVLKANDRRTSCPCHDEFRGPRSDYVRQAVGSYSVLMSSSTTRQRFLDLGLRARVPLDKIPFTANHQRLRLQ
ncbi:hypothetical protein TNCV_4102891 [Trichonephila clavipes]|nr:hypothetical protein TNCV_4102891 [Trichonephila clavipes]